MEYESYVAVQIIRFVDPHNPGIVEGIFSDAEGKVHNFVDKVPIFTCEQLDAQSTYPRSGVLPCTVLEEWRDVGGRQLVRIQTFDSTEGKYEFVVRSEQLLERNL